MLWTSQKKEFDEMWDIPRLYVSFCSNSVQLVPLQPIIISILFHHCKELKECMREVDQIDATTNMQDELQIDLKEAEPVGLDNYIVSTS